MKFSPVLLLVSALVLCLPAAGQGDVPHPGENKTLIAKRGQRSDAELPWSEWGSVREWCDVSGYPAGIREFLLEQDTAAEERSIWIAEQLAGISVNVGEERLAFQSGKLKLRDEVVSKLRKIIDKESAGRKADPLGRVLDLVGLCENLEGGQKEVPVPLDALGEERRRGRKRKVKRLGASVELETSAFEGHEYAVMPISMGWYEAKRWCESVGGYLACIESSAEMDFLRAEVVDDDLRTVSLDGAIDPCSFNYWVGASDSIQGGGWTWISGASVDKGLFLATNSPSWVQHHAVLVLYQPEGQECRIGLNDFSAPSRCRSICEWGSTPLQPPWDTLLTRREVDEILRPYWTALQGLQQQYGKAGARKADTRLLEKLRRDYGDALVDQRKEASKRLRATRREALRSKDHLMARWSDEASAAVDAGSLECAPPQVSRSSEPVETVVARAFGRTYLAIEAAMTWHEADLHCRSLGGRLPDPASRLEAALINYILLITYRMDGTWLNVINHPGVEWSNGRGVLSDSSEWVETQVEDVELGKSWLYAHALFMSESAWGTAPEDHPFNGKEIGPGNCAPVNTEIRKRFFCVL